MVRVCEIKQNLKTRYIEALLGKLYDPDEKFRAALCKLFSQLDYEAALHHLSVDVLKGVAGRGLDKKVGVRLVSLTPSLMCFFSTASVSRLSTRWDGCIVSHIRKCRCHITWATVLSLTVA